MPRGLMSTAVRDPRNFSLVEWQQARQTGKNPKETKAVFQECWAASDGQKAFAQALKERRTDRLAKTKRLRKHWKRTAVRGERSGISTVNFGELLPEELLWTEDPETGERLRMTPGILRRCDVKVGRHVPVSPGALTRFLNRFETVYGGLGKSEAILAAAAAHHRLLWIHPFLDGNGRVARLMSHATLLEVLDTGGIWSVARGLARNARFNWAGASRRGPGTHRHAGAVVVDRQDHPRLGCSIYPPP